MGKPWVLPWWAVAHTDWRLAMSETIIALDLGWYNSVVCVHDRRTRVHAFRTRDTTPRRLGPPGPPPGVLVIEACVNAGGPPTSPPLLATP